MCCHGDYILVSNRIETSCVTFCVLDCASYCDNVLGRGEREKGEGTDERGKGKRRGNEWAAGGGRKYAELLNSLCSIGTHTTN